MDTNEARLPGEGGAPRGLSRSVAGEARLICSKRLQPFLPEIVEVLERAGELTLPPETERLLVRMSPATIDHLLQTHRYRRPRSTPKPGSLLRRASSKRRFPCGPSLTGMMLVRAFWRRRAYAEELDCRPSVDRL